jgi:hypothetical protein
MVKTHCQNCQLARRHPVDSLKGNWWSSSRICLFLQFRRIPREDHSRSRGAAFAQTRAEGPAITTLAG